MLNRKKAVVAEAIVIVGAQPVELLSGKSHVGTVAVLHPFTVQALELRSAAWTNLFHDFTKIMKSVLICFL